PRRIEDAPLAQALRQLRYPGSFARISAALLVELPGIDSARKSNWPAATLDSTTRKHAKSCETTCTNARGVDGVNNSHHELAVPGVRTT
ncbi:MAG: hypothetical protein WBM01_19405, partial [Mycobacterium sp.]